MNIFQRWYPIEGFSSKLLPTDRFRFSSADGTCDRSMDKIRLPSMAWQWEGDWKIELTLNGQPLDHNGWTYAIDFPTQYHPKKQWTSCVRRRLWVRSRRYSAMNSWCAIAPLHKDATSVGAQYTGHDLKISYSLHISCSFIILFLYYHLRIQLANVQKKGSLLYI